MECGDEKQFFSNKIKMLSDSDQKKMAAAILRGEESAGSLKTIISSDQAGATHVNTLHSFSTCLSLLQSSSHQANKKRKIYGEGEGKGEEFILDSPTPVVDDGYSWRKYGQKIIKNSPHQRNYYRCSGSNCNGRKHVQKIQDSPSIFRTTYVGEHMCQAKVSVHDNGSSTIIQFEQASGDSINGEGEGKGEKLIRDSPTAVVDDGFSWRKYGQKIIKKSPHQRNYYRCSGCNCKARKYVQKIQDSPPIFRNTYVGQHMCQADLFLQSGNESSTMLRFDLASTDCIDDKRPIPVPVMNQEWCDDYDMLNDVWISDEFETILAHNNYDLDRFQI